MICEEHGIQEGTTANKGSISNYGYHVFCLHSALYIHRCFFITIGVSVVLGLTLF